MIHSFQIKNYRGFENFKIEPLERVNLIAGSNNVGKTSLLEAMYLNLAPGPAFRSNLGGNQESATQHNLFRGLRDIKFTKDHVSRWGWLFHRKDLNQDIELTSSDGNGGTQKLVMDWLIRDSTDVGVPIPSEMPVDDLPIYLSVRYVGITGTTFEWSVDQNGSTIPPEHRLNSIPLRLLFNLTSRTQDEDTKWFSKLDDLGRQAEIVNILQLIEPRLSSLSVSVAEGAPMVVGDIGIGRKVPMTLMGEGMVRLLSLVLEITNASGGIVLVDEIENGLHYSVMSKVWKAVAAAAEQSNTQIIATTHSFECIRAAHEAFLEREEYDFRLHRLDRIKDEIRAVTYDADMLSAAMISDFEVR